MRKWYPAVLIAAAFITSIIVYPRLPDHVPIHWNAHGEVNGYGTKPLGLFLLPIMMLGIWGLLRALPKIDPRRENYARMAGAYDLIVNVVITAMAVIHLSSVAAMLGTRMSLPRIMPALLGLMLIVLGSVLPKTRPNWFFGIRTPWTLSSDRVWERTHRVGGYLMIGAGVVGIISSALPFFVGFTAIGVAVAIAGLGSVIYSYVAWKQEKSK